jgi:ATP-dependent Clp protease adapter protein ClpS
VKLVLFCSQVTSQLGPQAKVAVMPILLGVFVVGPVVLFFALQWIARRWLRDRPSSLLAAKITRSVPRAGGGNVPPSIILPPETSLLTLPDFVPQGFNCGVEVLNDNATPMEFVVSMLTSHLGLGRQEAVRVMLEIHTKGGALLATATETAATVAAEAITREASNRSHPLVCRAVKGA